MPSDAPTSRRRLALASAVLAGLVVGLVLGIRLMGPHASVPAPWSANFSGTPSAPQDFCTTEFDCNEFQQSAEANIPMDAQHGTDCSAFPNTHPIVTYPNSIFLCNNHVMTSIASKTRDSLVEGYAEVALTPDQLVDVSGGATATVTYKVSTNRTASRDWYEIFFSPYAQNLQDPLNSGNGRAIQGPPADSFEIMLASFNGQSAITVAQYSNYVQSILTGDRTTTIEQKVGGYSSSTRTPFEIDFSTTHIKFGIPVCAAGAFGCVGASLGTACPTGGCPAFWWVDTNFPTALNSTQYVLQITHHDYATFKSCTAGVPTAETTCLPDTWHWSDLGISSAVPFTVDKGTPDSIGPNIWYQGCGCPQIITTTVTLAAPTTANAYLRFNALAYVQYSVDGGLTYQPAVQQVASIHPSTGFNSYWTPIPSGVSTVLLKTQAPLASPGVAWMTRDITVWSNP